jgi:DNA processing protein
MTHLEAALLALIGCSHRSLQSAMMRIVLGRPTEDDAQIPPLLPAEARFDWMVRLASQVHAARSRNGRRPSGPLHAVACAQLARAARLGIWPLALGEDAFPPQLAAIADPPPVLWGRGHRADLLRCGIALVGSRAASTYGLTMARRLAADLAAAGVVVVSGLARGVDSAAHHGALEGGGRTIAVLGSGVDRVYPPEHQELAARIEAAGAVVSELAPGTPPRGFHFPRRNRIISGLAAGVVVVEAPEKSGALITAAAALDQGREVMVVPGPVLGGRNRGGHALARDGAKVVESADDILGDLGPVSSAAAGRSPRTESHPLLRHLTEGVEYTVDEVSTLVALPITRVMAELLELELAGRIQRVGGARFVRCSDRV